MNKIHVIWFMVCWAVGAWNFFNGAAILGGKNQLHKLIIVSLLWPFLTLMIIANIIVIPFMMVFGKKKQPVSRKKRKRK